MDEPAVKLTAAEQAAMELVKRHQGFTAAELAHIAGRDKESMWIANVMARLVKKGLVELGPVRDRMPTYRVKQSTVSSEQRKESSNEILL
jgi:predicted transcriptional regulator